MRGDITRVLKAPTQSVTDFASLQLPMYASDKEDGIRCIIHPKHGPVSQKMLEIPNVWVKMLLTAHCPVYLDGELVALDCEGNDASFNDTQSAIMSEEGQPAFEFRVFDCFWNIYDPYWKRMEQAKKFIFEDSTDDCIRWLPHYLCESVADIEKYEESALVRGKEGIMLNCRGGWYKEGRSTFNEAYLLKVKRFVDDEVVVIGLEEEMMNCNPATSDAGGLQKRSKHQANLKGKGMVGRLICRWRDKTLKIGSGLSGLQKHRWWAQPDMIVGKTITFKYQAHGMKDLPRAPIFKGIRYD